MLTGRSFSLTNLTPSENRILHAYEQGSPWAPAGGANGAAEGPLGLLVARFFLARPFLPGPGMWQIISQMHRSSKEFLMSSASNPKLHLKYSWFVERLSREAFLFLSEEARHLVSGTLYEGMLPLLEQGSTEAEIVTQLIGRAPASEIRAALQLLRREGLLRSDESTDQRSEAWWELAENDAARTTRRSEGAVELKTLLTTDR